MCFALAQTLRALSITRPNGKVAYVLGDDVASITPAFRSVSGDNVTCPGSHVTSEVIRQFTTPGTRVVSVPVSHCGVYQKSDLLSGLAWVADRVDFEKTNILAIAVDMNLLPASSIVRDKVTAMSSGGVVVGVARGFWRDLPRGIMTIDIDDHGSQRSLNSKGTACVTSDDDAPHGCRYWLGATALIVSGVFAVLLVGVLMCTFMWSARARKTTVSEHPKPFPEIAAAPSCDKHRGSNGPAPFALVADNVSRPVSPMSRVEDNTSSPRSVQTYMPDMGNAGYDGTHGRPVLYARSPDRSAGYAAVTVADAASPEHFDPWSNLISTAASTPQPETVRRGVDTPAELAFASISLDAFAHSDSRSGKHVRRRCSHESDVPLSGSAPTF